MKAIYKITNKINGKIYVGSTLDFNKRKKDHFTSLRNGRHDNRFLQRSFDKYGEENFIIEIIEEIFDDKIRYEKERYYIKLYDTLNNKKGYNLSLSSDNGGCSVFRDLPDSAKTIYGICQYTNKILVVYESVQDAMNKLHKGVQRKIDKENRFASNMALVSKEKYDSNKDYRKKYKPKYIKTGRRGKVGKPVETYDLKTFEVIKKYKNTKELANEFDSSQKYVTKVIRGERKSFKNMGIRWSEI